MIARSSILVLLAACATTAPSGTTTSAPARQASEFFPLSVGTGWEYEAAMLGEKRKLPVSIARIVDGVAEDSTGARFLSDAWGVRDDKRYLLRNPIEQGTKWNNVVSPSSVESYEILATEQPCEAPAGRYEGCVVVESRNRIDQARVLVNEITLAPGVGIVRMATTLEEKGGRIPQSTLTLLRFTRSAQAVDAGKPAQ